MLATALPGSERVSGAEHPDTLTVRTNLARFTGLAGDAAAAWDLLATLLPLIERVLGAEHPSTQTARAGGEPWPPLAVDLAGSEAG